MNIEEIIKKLRSFRRKWRAEVTRERKFQIEMRKKYDGNYIPPCFEKSVGIEIGFNQCSYEVDRLIKTLEESGLSE